MKHQIVHILQKYFLNPPIKLALACDGVAAARICVARNERAENGEASAHARWRWTYRGNSSSEKQSSGTIHTNGDVDIRFTRPIHDALLAEGLAELHGWVPNSGWITFRIRSERDVAHALWLMRLSYLRYALKETTDPRRLFESECEELRLRPCFKSLLEPFVPKNRRAALAEPLLA